MIYSRSCLRDHGATRYVPIIMLYPQYVHVYGREVTEEKYIKEKYVMAKIYYGNLHSRIVQRTSPFNNHCVALF